MNYCHFERLAPLRTRMYEILSCLDSSAVACSESLVVLDFVQSAGLQILVILDCQSISYECGSVV